MVDTKINFVYYSDTVTKRSTQMTQDLEYRFRQHVADCLDKAAKLFDVPMIKYAEVRLDIRGYRIAGQAGRCGSRYFLRFHPDAIKKHWDEMVNDTVPHEVAHLVCFMRPELGRDHNNGWKRVCRLLGGDDSRTHSLEFGERKERPEYWYVTTEGHMVDIGAKRHKRLQAQEVSCYTARGKGRILASGYVPEKTKVPAKPAVAKKPVSQDIQGKSGSKAEQARAYIQALIKEGQSLESLLHDTALHSKQLESMLGFGTYGAARSCFVANVNKLFGK